ncbi:hypothetical protein TRVA0_046S01134 [Trichomonascus vanleenenianus]|uniref:phytanoyl-CoA dioxygenase family protein n=1 Tax=Trichomonascus vanleenenianus TaxID=2268995 RepID=UPI003ECA04C0
MVETVKATNTEKTTGAWNNDNLRRIVEGMRKDGVVILQDLIDPSHLTALNEFMEPDAWRVREDPESLNFGTENIQQAPPLHLTEHLYEDVYGNKLLFEAILHVLGPGAKWDFVSGNTALPQSTRRQPVHADENMSHIASPGYVVANIPLIDMSVETGSTEMWPGTHLLRDESIFDDPHSKESPSIKAAIVDARRTRVPPLQPTVPKGSVVIRDLSLWHCGVPNPSDKVRCMIAFGFSSKWWDNGTRFKVPDEKTAALLSSWAEAGGMMAQPAPVADPSTYLVEKDKKDFQLGESRPAL